MNSIINYADVLFNRIELSQAFIDAGCDLVYVASTSQDICDKYYDVLDTKSQLIDELDDVDYDALEDADIVCCGDIAQATQLIEVGTLLPKVLIYEDDAVQAAGSDKNTEDVIDKYYNLCGDWALSNSKSRLFIRVRQENNEGAEGLIDDNSVIDESTCRQLAEAICEKVFPEAYMNAEYFGDGVDEEEAGGDDAYFKGDLKTSPWDFSVFEMHRKSTQDDPTVILDSSFQRDRVWNGKQNSELIESVLMGLPIPVFYLNMDRVGKYIVVDGRQRLSALFDYLDNQYPLRGLKIYKQFNGKKFSDLEPVYARRIEDYQLHTYVIPATTPEKVKYDIFDRVNRGGVKLNNQEIRNALYQGKSTELLKKVASSQEFIDATGQSFVKEKRMKDKYLITRYFAMWLYYRNKLPNQKGEPYVYKGIIDDLLGRTLSQINNMNSVKVDKMYDNTTRVLRSVYEVLGKDAFRMKKCSYRTPINMNLFETLMLAFTIASDKIDADKARDYVDKMIQSKEYIDNITVRRDAVNQYECRVKMAEQLGEDITVND